MWNDETKRKPNFWIESLVKACGVYSENIEVILISLWSLELAFLSFFYFHLCLFIHFVLIPYIFIIILLLLFTIIPHSRQCTTLVSFASTNSINLNLNLFNASLCSINSCHIMRPIGHQWRISIECANIHLFRQQFIILLSESICQIDDLFKRFSMALEIRKWFNIFFGARYSYNANLFSMNFTVKVAISLTFLRIYDSISPFL